MKQGLLAALGLKPTPSMLAMAGAMADLAPPPPVQAAAFGASSAAASNDQWSQDDGSSEVVIATPYGAYYCHWTEEEKVRPILQDVLDHLPDARRDHAALQESQTALERARAVIEAGPHTPQTIFTDVRANPSAKASEAALSSRLSNAVGQIGAGLFESALGALDVARAQWKVAADALQDRTDLDAAQALKDQVKAEQDYVTEVFDITAEAIGLVGKIAKGEKNPAEYIGTALKYTAKGVNYCIGKERTERAEALEKKAKANQLEGLSATIRIVETQIALAAKALQTLLPQLSEVDLVQRTQRRHAAEHFDAETRGNFQLSAFLRGIELAQAMREPAKKALQSAKLALERASTLADLPGPDSIRVSEVAAVTRAMLSETTGWKTSAERALAAIDPAVDEWSSLIDWALQSMSEDSGAREPAPML